MIQRILFESKIIADYGSNQRDREFMKHLNSIKKKEIQNCPRKNTRKLKAKRKSSITKPRMTFVVLYLKKLGTSLTDGNEFFPKDFLKVFL